ncbi:hypothetical protein [Sphingomonas sp. LHG3443-2]|uniref:hypothetical protein n=1 Tax=Sphingomonas sp. LHG3443-2 TaxID=2804639 RepID=UPI003CF9AEC1
MHRSFALFFALILATVSIATTGFAADADILRFEVSDSGKERLQLALRRNTAPNRSSGSSFEVRELAGFDRAALRKDGTPVRFALVREPGRLDCSGRSDDRRARGNCRFTADPAFANFLVAAGMRRPTESETIDLTMVGAKRSLVEALRQGRYAMPSPSGLAGLTALNVTPDYIRTMAASGYRPRRTEDFITLKALDVSPAYIASLKRVGYDRVPVEELIQLKALGVTADFIASYQRRGYRNLSVSRLVQLKALGIRPEEIGRSGSGRPIAMTSEVAPVIMSALLP